MEFKLKSKYTPAGHQPRAIAQLVEGLKAHRRDQVLLGVTGSGKTFTVANVINQIQRPTLVISHNKTLAAQLYQEFRDYFPEAAVSYFVSYYDYYQPEAYIPQTDTYIEKETDINQEIDKLRLAATTNLLTRKDVIIVASVSCIYNLGSPIEYGKFVLELKKGMFPITRESVIERLIDLQYQRSDYDLKRSTFKVVGQVVELWPSWEDAIFRLEIVEDKLIKLVKHELISRKTIEELDSWMVYPAKHYMVDPKSHQEVFARIEKDARVQEKRLREKGLEFEARRLRLRVEYDLEMIGEAGYVNGIENYSRYFDGRKAGDPPYTLLDYFNHKTRDWLCVIDESHITAPQLRGMVRGDKSRKETLIDFGFRLPSALDNRPLTFEEFRERTGETIFMSATPKEWEIEEAKKSFSLTGGVVEQLVRPTGLVDPQIEIRKTEGQIDDLIREIKKRAKKGERVLVTTLTKRMAEELADYLDESSKNSEPGTGKKIKTAYLHADIKTLERSDILDDLRRGKYDVLVGINLLREGLDLPEVSLVAILDADREGFLRSRTSLIQVMGRASRHVKGKVIMYADKITNSMREAIEEVSRRRQIQLEWNKKRGVKPKSIEKEIRKKLIVDYGNKDEDGGAKTFEELDYNELLPQERKQLKSELRRQMKAAAGELDFEKATIIRDRILEIENNGLHRN